MLLSTGIILSAFAGITYVLVNKLEPDSAHAKVSHPENAHPTAENAHPTSGNAHPTSGNAHPTSENAHPTSENAHPTSENTTHEKETLPWSYEGEHGPAHWGQFAPLALSGIRQSPIDLVGDRALNPRNLVPMSFH